MQEVKNVTTTETVRRVVGTGINKINPTETGNITTVNRPNFTAKNITYDVPTTMVQNGGKGRTTVGWKMGALLLNPGEGSTPADNAQSGLMHALPSGNNMSNDCYIRGHLLNEHLGGPGQDYNLYPLTGSANHIHLVNIENKVKDNVKDQYLVYYAVEMLGSNAITGGRATTPTDFDATLRATTARFVLDGNAYVRDGPQHTTDIQTKYGTTLPGTKLTNVNNSNEVKYTLDNTLAYKKFHLMKHYAASGSDSELKTTDNRWFENLINPDEIKTANLNMNGWTKDSNPIRTDLPNALNALDNPSFSEKEVDDISTNSVNKTKPAKGLAVAIFESVLSTLATTPMSQTTVLAYTAEIAKIRTSLDNQINEMSPGLEPSFTTWATTPPTNTADGVHKIETKYKTNVSVTPVKLLGQTHLIKLNKI